MSLTCKFENAVMYNYYQDFEHMVKKSKTTPQVMPCHGQIQLRVDRVAGDLFNQALWFFSAKKRVKLGSSWYCEIYIHRYIYVRVCVYIYVYIYLMNLIESR